ncbi:DNA mismatch repair endonuclease MutL [Clostridium sp. BJN0001]|uniref:DNA mismatch repair endonuclease MutL n=1 Tax=Clostridium sp. BJN0001 TaxID=2930219 RepID=UPI001FD4E221|nr:DNA mismatch repair endonuclease MutL [Clostridium sp. BJN0001]
MGKINILDDDTSNKIAAGEVIERPVSVVKELVENSIDADAKNILIEVKDGGESLIKIIDDGLGIEKDDIKKAFLPHATSKIKESDDIFKINTLGFRGEALPSIASISKLTLKTKTKEDTYGNSLSIEGGNIVNESQCAVNNGTSIEIKDLFYNVPARKKFLKTTSKESSLINDIITRIALSNKDISFKLINNSKNVIHTFKTDNLKDTIQMLYGKNIVKNIIYFENSLDVMTIYGYIGKEEIARRSRNNQSIFVNKRYVKNRSVQVAVEQAFKSFSTVNKFPFFILFIDIYPEFVDVNIHPSKAEVKFLNEREVFKCVFDSVHEALKNEVFDTFKIEGEDKKPSPSFEEIKFKITEQENNINKNISDIITKDNEKNKILDNNISDTLISPNIPNRNEDNEDQKKEPVSNDFESKTFIEEEKVKEAKFPEINIIGQYNKTYILGEYDGELYIIDQHAASEKIMFEKYLNDIKTGDIIIQPLLTPIVIELSQNDYSYFEENKNVFKQAGFIIDEFGNNSISIKEIPYFLGKLYDKKFFLDILDNIKNLGSGKTTEVKHLAIATKACKAAIKGNDKLEKIEMEKLVHDLRYLDDPFHCPHGRPVIIKFTSTDIDKKFRRIV